MKFYSEVKTKNTNGLKALLTMFFFRHEITGKPILRYFMACDCMGNYFSTIVYEETIVQYTGTSDKDHKKIFECDIVRAYKHNEEPFIAVVTKRDGCFWFGNWNWCEFLNIFRNYEIIGNVFDNPELHSSIINNKE